MAPMRDQRKSWCGMVFRVRVVELRTEKDETARAFRPVKRAVPLTYMDDSRSEEAALSLWVNITTSRIMYRITLSVNSSALEPVYMRWNPVDQVWRTIQDAYHHRPLTIPDSAMREMVQNGNRWVYDADDKSEDLKEVKKIPDPQNGEYVVVYIHDHKYSGGSWLFKLRWLDWDMTDWVPEGQMDGCKLLLAEYRTNRMQ